MVGRIQEQQELLRAYKSKESEFIMVYGRRRVGKTYLIREFFKDNFEFSCTGIAQGTKEEELMNFRTALERSAPSQDYPIFKNWMKAFDALRSLLENSKKERKVVFLDEVPWMQTQKSDFLKALEHFWNDWACRQHNIILIVCGSAASWMVKKIINSKGGLHNRITLPIKLQPFTLKETEEYLHSQHIKWDRKTIAESYMILGGIPYYLKLLDKGLSLAQNIDRLFFANNAILKGEFENLYSSLFRDSKDYITIVETLSKKSKGCTREEILSKSKFKDGGGVTAKLDDLAECGFIRRYNSRGDVSYIYQLTDFFTMYYFRFIKKGAYEDESFWLHTQQTPSYSTWKGLSFEKLCLWHLPQIKRALGVDGISSKAFAYLDKNIQVDMILERADRVVNIFEMKYYDGQLSISAKYADTLNTRKQIISKLYKNKLSFSTVLLTADGLKENEFSTASVQIALTLDSLFS
ncbi:MAG: ATP-binding protein [Bacteroidales bacterium]|nr:ATP-binding protein [Bacteroidales bacterium]